MKFEDIMKDTLRDIGCCVRTSGWNESNNLGKLINYSSDIIVYHLGNRKMDDKNHGY